MQQRGVVQPSASAWASHTVIVPKLVLPDFIDYRRVNAVTDHNYPVPTDLTKRCQFLGLESYYRRFVPGFAKLLIHSIKKRIAFEWDAACQTAFNKLG